MEGNKLKKRDIKSLQTKDSSLFEIMFSSNHNQEYLDLFQLDWEANKKYYKNIRNM